MCSWILRPSQSSDGFLFLSLLYYIILYIMKNSIIIYSDWLQSNNWYGLNVKWKKNIGNARASFLKSTLPLDSWDVSSLKKSNDKINVLWWLWMTNKHRRSSYIIRLKIFWCRFCKTWCKLWCFYKISRYQVSW